MNLSAKLEKHNKDEQALALCPQSTYALAVQQGFAAPASIETREARRIAGVSEPLDLAILAA